MKNSEFQKRIQTHPKPMIVDLWAPWCGPCRAMEPAFKQVSQKYSGEVDVLKINADDSPDVLKALKVMGIPTVIGFAGGKEILRRTGTQSVAGLELLFEAAKNQRKPDIIPPAPLDRLIRSVLGLALFVLGWFTWHSILGMAFGGLVLFSAFYDRCPVYRALAPRIKSLFQRSK
jgi:thioredoxin